MRLELADLHKIATPAAKDRQVARSSCHKYAEIRRYAGCSLNVRILRKDPLFVQKLQRSIGDQTRCHRGHHSGVSETRYRRFFESAKEGLLIVDANTGTVMEVNPFLVELLASTRERILGKTIWELGSFNDLIPDHAAFAKLQKHEGFECANVWIRTDSEQQRNVEFVSSVYLENRRKVVQCNIRLINRHSRTEEALRESQQLIEGIINAIPVRVFWKDKNLVYSGCNSVFARDAGFAEPKDIIGKNDYQLVWRDQAELYRSDDRQVIYSRCPKGPIEEPQTTPEGNTITLLTSKMPLTDQFGEVCGVLGTYIDITERKRAEETMHRAISALKTLSNCSTALIRADDEESLLKEICRILVSMSGYQLAWVGLAEDDPQKSVRAVAHAGYTNGFTEQSEISWDIAAPRRGPVGDAIYSCEPQLIGNAHSDRRYEPWRESAIKIGYRSVLSLPLMTSGTAVGALSIYAAESDAFDDQQIRLLSGLANEIAFGIVALRARTKHQESEQRLQRGMEATIAALAGTLELRDAYTAGHQRRVAQLAAAMATEMGISEDEIHGIHLAAMVHDLGKIQVPAEILTKPTKLTNLELELVKTHAQAGHDLLKAIDFPWPIAQLVYQHHERVDGSGYPRGLQGKDTLMGAKILSVADTVEAMSSHRPYRAGLGIEASLVEIKNNREILYDGQVVDACLRLFAEKGFAFS